MASYYGSATPTSPTIPQTPYGAAPNAPPPPPPKSSSHDPSRSSTPSKIPSVGSQYTPFDAAPPVPPSPSHAHALDLQQQRQHQQTQQQHPQQQHQQQPPIPSRLQRHDQLFSPTATPTQQTSYNQQQPQLQPQQQNQDWLPPQLSTKSTLDLNTLVTSPSSADVLTSLSHTHPTYTSATSALQSAVSANLELAAQVTALEAQVRQVRDQTAQLILSHASLQTQWRRKQAEMEEVLAPWGPRGMYQRLVAGIAEQEAVLRAVHESFLEGGAGGGNGGGADGHGKASEKEVTEWIKRIREGTTILEKRREMRARWDEGRVGGWR